MFDNYFEQDTKIKSSPKIVQFFACCILPKLPTYVVILNWNYLGKLFSNVWNKDSNIATFQINRQKIKCIFNHPVDRLQNMKFEWLPYRPKWSSKGMYEFLHTNSSLAKGCLILENLKKMRQIMPLGSIHLKRYYSGAWFGIFFGDLSRSEKLS